MDAASDSRQARSAAQLAAGLQPPAAGDARGAGAPEWIHLLPQGPELSGRDGRAWRLDDPHAVVAATRLPLAVTYDHAGFFGREAPAAGWIEALEVRADGVWGRVEWTADGRAAVEGKAYRFVSPEFVHDADPPRRIGALLGAGLTNSPNLDLAAAASRRPGGAAQSKEKASVTPAILSALGLEAEAGEADALAAVEALRGAAEKGKAAAAASAAGQQPDLARYVPRADYDAACARLRKAEAALAAQHAAAAEEAVETAVEEALAAGKIVPATADYHRAQCRLEGGLERFRAFCAAAPEIAAASAASARPPASADPAALDPAARKIFASLGVAPDEARQYAARRAGA